jgi:Domain of unknown function (DUF4249)
MKNIIIAILLIVSIISCEKSVIVDVPVQPSKLVMNGIVNTASVFNVKVGKSEAVLASNTVNSFKVNNAFVQLFENGMLKDTFLYNATTENYIAKNGTIPVPTKTYLLKATLNGFANVEAETVTPSNIAIQSIVRRVNARTDADGNMQDEVKIKFQDIVGESNYYIFNMRRPIFYNGSTVSYGLVSCIKSNDVDIERSNNGDPTDINSCIGNEFLMTDKNFNGRIKEITLFINSQELVTYTHPITLRKYNPVLEISNITADHFKYKRSLENFRDNNDNPFSEPVLVFGNVKNGYGIFTSFSIARDTIR